jgi:hypothetical protein
LQNNKYKKKKKTKKTNKQYKKKSVLVPKISRASSPWASVSYSRKISIEGERRKEEGRREESGGGKDEKLVE